MPADCELRTPLIDNPRMIVPHPATKRPCGPAAAVLPSISTVGATPLQLPAGAASMITGSSIPGNPVAGVIVCGAAPGIANRIVSVKPALALESSSACLSDPGPLSFVLVTTKVCAPATTVIGVLT